MAVRTHALLPTLLIAAAAACGQIQAPPADSDARIEPDARIDPDAAADDSALIDDLEDGDDAVAARGGRAGVWSIVHDRTPGGVQTPSMPFAPTLGGVTGSRYCAGTTGYGFTDWGASLQVDLDHPASGRARPYDASAYTGIQFQARGNVKVEAQVVMPAALAVDNGGTCTPGERPCNDFHGWAIQLGPEWVEYRLPFADIAQQGWGTAAPFDPTQALRVRFGIAKGLTFNLCVDNLRFY